MHVSYKSLFAIHDKAYDGGVYVCRQRYFLMCELRIVARHFMVGEMQQSVTILGDSHWTLQTVPIVIEK